MNPMARMIAKLSLVVMLFVGLAQAQYVAAVVNVDVPFEFTVSSKTFPAGRYSVVRVAPSTLMLRNARGGVVATLVTSIVRASNVRDVPALSFRTEGGQHTLAQVWFQGSASGNVLPTPNRRTSLAKVQGDAERATGQP